MGLLPDDFADTLLAAPELTRAPGLAAPIAQAGGQTTANAQSVAQAADYQALDGAHATVTQAIHHSVLHGALSWLGGAFHEVAHVAGATLKPAAAVLNAPLQEVQHQYRYLRDVEAQHGPIAALLEGAGIAAGGVGGFFAGGFTPQGAILGAEGVAELLGHVAYKDSWARTAPGRGYVDPSTGKSVSPGRDIAHLFGVGNGAWTSGIVDGLFDLAADPLAQAGGIYHDVQSAEGVKGAILGREFAGRAMVTPEAVDRIAQQYPNVQRAYRDLAGLTAGQIITRYPKFRTLATDLGEASTANEVHAVFRDAARSQELLTATNVAPSLALTRIPLRSAQDAIANLGDSGNALARAMDRKFVRPTTLLPTYFDADLLKYSSRKFDPSDPAAADGIYRTVRMGESRRVAEGVAANFAEAAKTGDVEKAVDIYRNAVTDMLIHRAHVEPGSMTAEDIAQLRSRVNELTSGMGKEAVYGGDTEGHNVSKVFRPDGSSVSAGITDNQTGDVAFPDFTAVKRVTTDLQNGRTMFGTADDWLYDHYTQGVFKKLVLLSGGFAQRMAAAEAIPGALRNGLTNIVRNAISAHVAADSLNEETPHALAAVYRALRGKVANQQDVEDLAKGIAAVGGHTVTPALRPETHVDAEVVGAQESKIHDLRRAANSVPRGQVLGNDFAMFGPESDQYDPDTWQRWLSEVSQDQKSIRAAEAYLATGDKGAAANAATDWLRQQPESYRNKYLRSRYSSTPGVDPLEDWGRVATENMLAATAGHERLIRNVSEGVLPPRDLLAGLDKPAAMKGRIAMPDPRGTLDRIANVGYRRVIDPIINYLSREPLYATEYLKEYRLAQKSVTAGLISDDEAIALAHQRATQSMTPFVHNRLERSQFSTTVRNLMPFYFAQEQAYKRFGRLLTDDPQAFRQMQLAISGLADIGHHVTDPNGGQFLALPGSGWLTQASVFAASKLRIPIASAIPVSMSGSLKSLNSVLPFAEGIGPRFGPVVSIPAHLLDDFMPEGRQVIDRVIGDQAAGGSAWDAIIPNNTLKSALQAVGPNFDHRRAFQTSMMHAIQSAAFHGLTPGPSAGPMENQHFVDRIRNWTRVGYLAKALVSAISPVAPTLNPGDVGLRQEVRDQIAKKGLSQGIQDFLVAHPDATPYTVFTSESPTGARIAASQDAEKYYESHKGTLDAFPYAGAWFLPQSGNFDPKVYNEQLAQGLRRQKAPDQFLNDLYVSAGNSQYYKDADAHKAALTAAGNDTQAKNTERANWSAYIKTFGAQNPVWYDDFLSATRDIERTQAIDQMRQMFASGKAPAGPQTADLRELLADYDAHKAALTAGRTDSLAANANAAERENFAAYLDQLAKDKPNLAAVIAKVFKGAA